MGHHRIRLSFSDGVSRQNNFETLLHKKMGHGGWDIFIQHKSHREGAQKLSRISLANPFCNNRVYVFAR